jgi:hypothetical protein
LPWLKLTTCTPLSRATCKRLTALYASGPRITHAVLEERALVAVIGHAHGAGVVAVDRWSPKHAGRIEGEKSRETDSGTPLYSSTRGEHRGGFFIP